MSDPWLSGLNVGDKVCVYLGSFSRVPSVLKVERLTPTQILISGTSYRFNRKTGRAIGTSGYGGPCYLHEPTPEIEAEALRHRLEHKLLHQKWGAVPTETLSAICALLKEPT